ncbi:Ig-like domain-containing protein, partial [Candidatus Parcubacteria bacterium]|nr:Ig-like domain-containing protein [Candidatus Parcubacteria bacterium]
MPRHQPTKSKRYYKSKTRRSPSEWQLYKRLLTIAFYSTIILGAMYLWAIVILANINKFWDFFFGEKSDISLITKQDTIAPQPPFILSPPEATSQELITISGFTEEGATVALYLDGLESATALADKEGSFSFDRVRLSQGANRITARATDAIGNESQFAAEVTIVYDNEQPELALETPQEGLKVSGDEHKYLAVKGKTEAGAEVTINDYLAIVDGEGNFQYILTLKTGIN